MDVAALISRFATGSYAVRRWRQRPPTRGQGRVVLDSSFTIEASVVPVSAQDLERMPEGRRALESRALITATELKKGGDLDSLEADWVAIDGRDWEVQEVDVWRPYAGVSAPGYRCVVQAVAAQVSQERA